MSYRYKAIAAAVLSLAAIATVAPISLANAADLPAKVKAKPVPDLPFFFVIDDRVTFSYIFTAAQPGMWSQKPDGSINAKTAKQVYSFTHFDAWLYGTNFLTISLFKSDHNDPANPCINAGLSVTFDPAACAGASEVYGLFRSTFGWNELFNTKAFSVGPLHNVSFEVGMDANAENRFFAAAKRDVVAGLQFAFDLPYKGYFNVAPLVYWEFYNHNAFAQCNSGFNSNVPGLSCLVDGNTYLQADLGRRNQLLHGSRLPAREHAVLLDQRPHGVVRAEGDRYQVVAGAFGEQRVPHQDRIQLRTDPSDVRRQQGGLGPEV